MTPPPSLVQRGRPRGFDADTVVARAMEVFWSKGYSATALPDLLRATQLSRGSLYGAFGDKHALFLQALDRYVDEALARTARELADAANPVEGLRAHLAGYVERTSGAKGRRGCLLVAATTELAGHDPEVRRRVARFFQALDGLIADALTRARAAGALAPDVDPPTAARVIVCFVEGLRVVGKANEPSGHAQAAVDLLLRRLLT